MIFFREIIKFRPPGGSSMTKAPVVEDALKENPAFNDTEVEGLEVAISKDTHPCPNLQWNAYMFIVIWLSTLILRMDRLHTTGLAMYLLVKER